MHQDSPTHSTDKWIRLYTLCLRLYPHAFRRTYGREMVLLFQDCLREARVNGTQAVIEMVGRTLLDIGVSVPRAHFEEWTTMQTPYTRSSQAGSLAALVAVALLSAVAFMLTPMSLEHLATLLVFMLCFFGMMTALYRRLTPFGNSSLDVAGYGIGVFGTILAGGGLLLSLGMGPNGFAVMGIIGGFLVALVGFSLLGIRTATRTDLGIWRFAPGLALPLLLLILGVSAFVSEGQIESLYLYEVQSLLFVFTIGGTGILLWTTSRQR
jgi:hypothetical protein